MSRNLSRAVSKTEVTPRVCPRPRPATRGFSADFVGHSHESGRGPIAPLVVRCPSIRRRSLPHEQADHPAGKCSIRPKAPCFMRKTRVMARSVEVYSRADSIEEREGSTG